MVEPPFIVLGGLVPELLTRFQNIPVPLHLGTTDVDMLLDFQVADNNNLSTVEKVLDRLGFLPKAGTNGWRWIGYIRGMPVKLEFLCEFDDVNAEQVVRPHGCLKLGAMNLRGAGYVKEDWMIEEIKGSLPDGKNVAVKVRFAGLCGYLLAKAIALKERGEEKDYYDFVYVLIYNQLGGPAQAAKALRKGKFNDRLFSLKFSRVWQEIAERFATPDCVGCVGYAAQSVQADPMTNDSQKREDAKAAIREFLDALNFI